MTPKKHHPVVQAAMDRQREAADKSEGEALQRASDFEAVFGQPKKRSEPQRRVWEYLELAAGDAENSYQFNTAKDGLALIAAGIHRDGAKSLLQVVRLHLRNAAKRGFAPTKK